MMKKIFFITLLSAINFTFAQDYTLFKQFPKLKIFINSENKLSSADKDGWINYFSDYKIKLTEANFYSADSISVKLHYLKSDPLEMIFELYANKFDFDPVPFDETYYLFQDVMLANLINDLTYPLFINIQAPVVYEDLNKFLGSINALHESKENIIVLHFSAYITNNNLIKAWITYASISDKKSALKEIKVDPTTMRNFSFATRDIEFIKFLQNNFF